MNFVYFLKKKNFFYYKQNYNILLIKKLKYSNFCFKFIFKNKNKNFYILKKIYFLFKFFDINYNNKLKKNFINLKLKCLNYNNIKNIFIYIILNKILNLKNYKILFKILFSNIIYYYIIIKIIKKNIILKNYNLKNLFKFNQNEILKIKLKKNFFFKNKFNNNYIYFLEHGWFKNIIYYKNFNKKFFFYKIKFNLNNSIKYFHKNNFFNKTLIKKKYNINKTPKNKEIILQIIINLKLKQNWFYKKKKNINILLPLTTGYKNSLFFNYSKFIKYKDITTYGLYQIENILEYKFSIFNFPVYNLIGIIIIISIQNFEKLSKNFFFKIGCDFGLKKNLNWVFKNNFKYIDILIKKTEIIYGGFILSINKYSFNNISKNFFNSSLKYNSLYISTKNTFIYCFNLILESIIKKYNSYNIYINSIYFELIIKRMISCVKIKYNLDSTFFFGDKIKFNIINLINLSLNKYGFFLCKYKPIILGITKANLACSGFLSSISFQETIKLLIEASIIKKTDWFMDLKGQIISSDLIFSGSGWYKDFNI